MLAGSNEDGDSTGTRMMERRVVLFNRHYGGTKTPTGRMVRDLCVRFVEAGWTVVVYSCVSDYAGQDHISVDPGIRVVHLWGLRESYRIVNWLVYLIQVSCLAPFVAAELCIVLTDPPFLVVVAPIAKLFGLWRRVRVCWWTMDLYPRALACHGVIEMDGVAYRALVAIQRGCARWLNDIVCLDRKQLEIIRAECFDSQPKARFTVIPPWDDREIRLVDRESNRFLAENGLSGHKVFLYCGNLGAAHSFDEFLDGARELNRRKLFGYKFVFVVRGMRREALTNAARGMDNVIVLDYQRDEITSDLLCSAAVHLVSVREEWCGVVVPSKLSGVLQTAAPVLFVGPGECGVAVEILARGRGEVLGNGVRGDVIAEVLLRLADASPYRPVPREKGGAVMCSLLTKVSCESESSSVWE